MKKLGTLIIIVTTIILSGCATAPTPDAEIEVATAEAIGECYKAKSTIETARIAKLHDPKDILLDRAIAGLSEAAGKGADPCRLTTNNDLQKVAMEENTKQIVAGIDASKSAAGSIVTGLLGWKALDTLPDLFSGAGGTYNLTSQGDMSLSDSLKTSNMGDITGTNQLGGILSNPSTAEPYVFTFPAE